jgi:chemotaxis protein methyltransferase CheR
VNPLDLDFLARFLKERSGLVLIGDKSYLIDSRLTPVAKKHGFNDIPQLLQKLRAGAGPMLEQEVVEAMTTNETFFFRDKIPFDLFTDTMLPAMMEARAAEKRLRIWCAACSSGQEPYSLAMLLDQRAQQLAGWHIEILATDLSGEIIERAKSGRFNQFEVQRGLPVQMLLSYFEQKGEAWEIIPRMREKVQFRTLNLLRDFSPLGNFDIVFCRNVLIYFDEPTKIDVMNRLARMLRPDGYFVLGAAETVVGLTDAFRSVPEKRGLYVPNARPAVAALHPLTAATAAR